MAWRPVALVPLLGCGAGARLQPAPSQELHERFLSLLKKWSGWEPDLAWCSAVEPWWSSWLHQVFYTYHRRKQVVWHWRSWTYPDCKKSPLTLSHRACVLLWACTMHDPASTRCKSSLTHSSDYQIKNKACLDLGVLVLVLVTSSNLLLVRLRVYSIFCWYNHTGLDTDSTH